MTLCPFAIWDGPLPQSNYRPGGTSSLRGLVLHIMSGTMAGTRSWFHDPTSQVSSHFGVGKDGSLYQWVDLADVAYAEADGNDQWVSVENEGQSGDALTSAQLASVARLYGWLARIYGWPYVGTNDPAGTGLGWHGMGGQAWGGHPQCPGSPIINQRPEILSLAQQGDDDVTPADIAAIAKATADQIVQRIQTDTTHPTTLVSIRAVLDAIKAKLGA